MLPGGIGSVVPPASAPIAVGPSGFGASGLAAFAIVASLATGPPGVGVACGAAGSPAFCAVAPFAAGAGVDLCVAITSSSRKAVAAAPIAILFLCIWAFLRKSG